MDNVFSDKSPIYIQIIEYIKKEIVTSKLKCGDKLPSVRELSASLKVNPNTLQRAYQELELKGITCTKRGMGTFVVEDISMVNELKREMSKEVISTFISGMRSLGFEDNQIIEIVNEKIREKNISREED